MELPVTAIFFLILSCPRVATAQDIGFVMDVSDTISNNNFQREKLIIRGLTEAFEVKPGGSRAGLITFSRKARTVLKIGQHKTANEFSKWILGMKQRGGQSYINLALREATYQLFGSKYKEPKLENRVLFVLTDGKQTGRVNLKILTWSLRHFCVRIIVVAIGDYPNYYNLQQLVVNPTDIVIVRTNSNIKKAIAKIHLQGCKEKVPAVITEQCSKMIDFGFALDASGSIGKETFEKVKRFVKELLTNFNLSPMETRAGVIVYSTVPRLVIKMNEFYNLQHFFNAFSRRTYWQNRKIPQKLKWMGGFTAIDKALIMAQKELFTVENGDRPVVRNTLIFLTDGKQNPAAFHSLDYYSRTLKEANINIMAVGFGKAIKSELKKIASGQEFVFSYQGGAEVLKKAVEDIVLKICNSCQKKVNLGFVLDASNTVLNKFKAQKELISRIAEGFVIRQNESQATLIAFSDEAKVEIGFTSDLEAFKIDLHYVENMRGRTFIEKGLRAAEAEFDEHAYEDAPKVLLVLSDGRQTRHSKKVKKVADKLRKKGFIIFAIATSRWRNKKVLNYIAGEKRKIMNLERNTFTSLAPTVVRRACPEMTLEPEEKSEEAAENIALPDALFH